jgi:predicted nucleotidyltransferase
MKTNKSKCADKVESFNHSIISNAIEKYFKDCSFYFFHGSYFSGTPNENSDIDLIIVYKSAISPFRQKFVSDGFLFDVFVYDIETLNGALHQARVNGQFVTVAAVVHSETYPAPTPESKLIKNIAERVMSAGYLFTNRVFFRQYMTNIIDDLFENDIDHEIVMLSIELYKSIVEFTLINSGFGVCSRKHAAQTLNHTDSQFHQELNLSLRTAINGNPAAIIVLGKKVLDILGGPLSDGFKMTLPEIVRMPLPIM